MKFRKIYFGISLAVIAVGTFSLLKWGIPLGLDFTGGTLAEYKTSKDITKDDVSAKLKDKGLDLISLTKMSSGSYLLNFQPLEPEKKDVILEAIKEVDDKVEELRFEIVGASFGPELIEKTVFALAISAGLILLWVAIQFKSIKFGAAAIAAMLHDSLILLGLYSLFGHFYGAEADFLFVTAVLTILSFSVHDTIVVYDRIRELQKKGGGDIYTLANHAVTETMVRSLNNSFTIIFMLFALILLGGESIRWFAVALLIGTISGTYSSPFTAVPLLVTFEEISQRFKKR